MFARRRRAARSSALVGISHVPTPLAGAIRYTLGQWEGLTQFLSDGRIEVDNNTVERAIRPIPLGRKNALFAGSDSGGERWTWKAAQAPQTAVAA
jgi:transposase